MDTNYTLTKITHRIYHVHFDNHDDLWQTFMRYQEYYESPKFAGKIFTIEEFKEWYSKEYDWFGKFKYDRHWDGFNIPSRATKIKNIPDPNEYDDLMKEIVSKIDCKEEFYLIGTSIESDPSTLSHEIAHGFYALNESYRNHMNNLVDELPEKKFDHMRKILLKGGYVDHVIFDEIQAYMATGIHDNWRGIKKEIQEPFVQYFNETYDRIRSIEELLAWGAYGDQIIKNNPIDPEVQKRMDALLEKSRKITTRKKIEKKRYGYGDDTDLQGYYK